MKKTQRLNTMLANLISKVLRETKNGERISNKEEYSVLLAIEIELLFLRIYDYLRKENHSTYFRKRYLSIHNKMTKESLAIAQRLDV